MNDTVCHPKWVEGFVEECRNQGFTEKQASVFLETAFQRQMAAPMEKNAFRLLGKAVVGLGGLGLAGYGAKKLFEPNGEGSKAWDGLKYHANAIGDHIKGGWNGLMDGFKIGNPGTHAERAPHNMPGNNNFNSWDRNASNPRVQQQIDDFRRASEGTPLNNLSPLQSSDARLYRTRADSGYNAASSGNVKQLEDDMNYLDTFGQAYAGKEYARQRINEGMNQYFNNVQRDGRPVDQATYDTMRRLHSRLNGH